MAETFVEQTLQETLLSTQQEQVHLSGKAREQKREPHTWTLDKSRAQPRLSTSSRRNTDAPHPTRPVHCHSYASRLSVNLIDLSQTSICIAFDTCSNSRIIGTNMMGEVWIAEVMSQAPCLSCEGQRQSDRPSPWSSVHDHNTAPQPTGPVFLSPTPLHVSGFPLVCHMHGLCLSKGP